MKLYSIVILACLAFATSLFGQSNVQLFSPTNELQSSERQQLLTSNFLNKAAFFSLDDTTLKDLYTESRTNLSISIPAQGTEEITLQLERVAVTTPNLKIYNSYNELIDYEGGQHYRGTVVGHAQSIAAISIFEGEVMGVVAFGGRNYNLEKLHSISKRKNQAQYIFYAQSDVAGLPEFGCHTEDEPVDLQLPRQYIPRSSSRAEKLSAFPIQVYMECDNKMYRDFNSNIQQTVDFTTGLFNVTAGLFDGAGVTMEISEIKVWDTPDPYQANTNGASSGKSLEIFRCEAAVYNGRLAHLLSTGTRGLGGIAQLPSSELCPNGSANHGFSNIDPNYSTNLSVYSWSIAVLAHELGHQMSSPHTHACAWNDNNTAIDDCGSLSFVTNNADDDGDGTVDEDDEAEGSDCWNRNNPNIPNKGTIMSYCHLRAGNGIDLSRGFHPQVRERMASFANSCIDETVGCFAPSKEEITATDITEFSMRLNCSRTEGITFYYFSYRLPGQQDWINSGVQEESFWDIDGLTPNTTYEVRMFLFCDDWSGQSCVVTFRTAGVSECTGFDVEVAGISEPTCEASNGSVRLNILEGSPSFEVSWAGPVSGNTSTNFRNVSISDLPEGDYTVNITDRNDCSTSLDFRVSDDEDCAALRCQRKAIINCGQSINASLDGQPNDYDADDLRDCLPNATGLDGPDQAYELVLTERTGINIRLSGLSNDMDMYLLNTCVEGNACFGASLSFGTADEVLTGTIGPGTFYILIDRYEALTGGNDDYQLSVTCGDCNPDYQVTTINQVDPECEMQNGSIDLVVLNGIPGYTVNWQGPTSGTLQSNNSIISLENLAAGDYTVNIEDNTGCRIQTNFTMVSGCVCNEYEVSIDNVNPIDCDGNGGDFDLNIRGGQAPYTVRIQGTLFAELEIDTEFYQFLGLPEGRYEIKVTDANDCSQEGVVTIETDLSSCNCDLELSLDNAISPSCDSLSSGSFDINIIGGTPAFTITWTGASAGTLTTSDRLVMLDALPAGDYSLSISDADACLAQAFITIEEDLSCICTDFGISVNNIVRPTCTGELGSFRINLSGGEAIYQVSLLGVANEQININNSEYTFTGLAAGTYTVIVTDNNDCTASINVNLTEDTSACTCDDFTIALNNPLNPSCANDDGKFDIGITGGGNFFSIEVTTSSSGVLVDSTDARFYSVKNLSADNYEVIVRDETGCEAIASITLAAPEDCEEEEENLCEDFSIELKNPVNPNCDASDGKFDVTIQGGVSDFIIQVFSETFDTLTQVQGGRWYSVKNLPQGDYSVIVTDGNECVLTAAITLSEGEECEEEEENLCEGFSIELKNPLNPNCDASDGKFDVTIQGGQADFTIQVFSEAYDTLTQVQGGRWYTVRNLSQGNYTAIVTDGNGCVLTATITLSEGEECESSCQDFTVEVVQTRDANCGSSNGLIVLSVQNGTAPFTTTWEGAASGTQTDNSSEIFIVPLPKGEFIITVTDAKGCTVENVISLQEGFAISIEHCSSVFYDLEEGNSIQLIIEGGLGDFFISWVSDSTDYGVITGMATTSIGSYTIENLVAATYTITIRNDEGCTSIIEYTLEEETGCDCQRFSRFTFVGEEVLECDDDVGSFYISNIQNEQFPEYQTEGPFELRILHTDFMGMILGRDTLVSHIASFRVENATLGRYMLELEDLSTGCVAQDSSILLPKLPVRIDNIVQANCNGELGSFEAIILGGQAPYTIEDISGNDMNASIEPINSGYRLSNLQAGSVYTIRITDANNCEAELSQYIYALEDCNDACESLELLACDQSISGTTIGAENSFNSDDYDCYNQSADFGGGDVVYRIEVPENTLRLILELEDMSKDLDFFLLDDCEPGANCIAESRHNSAFLDESIRVSNPTAGTYYVVVDATSSDENSDFSLSVTCANGLGIGLIQNSAFQTTVDNWEAFPNPTTGDLLTRVSFSEATTARLEVINAMGQIVASHEVLNTDFIQHQFDLSNQAAGVYFLKLQTETETKVQQVVLMR